MTVEVFDYAMGFKVFLRGEREAFAVALSSLQESLPMAHRRFVDRGSVKYWHVEKRAEAALRSWTERMKQWGVTVLWREPVSEDTLRSKLIQSATKKQRRAA